MAAAGLLAHPFSVVDVETTGASAIYDRIIEVAVVRVAGGEVVERTSRLVDPRLAIPPFITRLTGIDDRAVRGHPTFAEVAPAIVEAVGDGPFVAHNASFDYAFVRHAMTRAGATFAVQSVCTLRLARRLAPGLRSYRLDALAAYFRIPINGRHRALGDAEATAQILLRLLDRAAELGVDDLEGLQRLQGLPVGRVRRRVDEAVIANLPAGPGVYLLKDEDGHVVYVGKSVRVRQRVREHLRGGSPGQPRLRRRLRAIVDVEAIETGSELEALFLESRLIKRYLPDANLLQRNDRDYPFIRIDLADPYPRVEATLERPTEGGLYFGPFRRRGTAGAAAELLRERFGLRDCTEPLRPGQSACALLDLGKCSGPCVGAIDRADYQGRVNRAVEVLHGDGAALVDELVVRRDRLAENWRFEEAAEVRDQIRALQHILGAQRRIDAVSERNLAIVAPSTRRGSHELFLIRAGQLVRQLGIGASVRRQTLSRALESAFTQPPPAVSREKVDEMHLLDTWLQRQKERATVLEVDPTHPAGSVDAIVRAVRPRLARPA